MAVAGTCHGGPDDGKRLEYWATRKEVFVPPLKNPGDIDEHRRAFKAGRSIGAYQWSMENGWTWVPAKPKK